MRITELVSKEETPNKEPWVQQGKTSLIQGEEKERPLLSEVQKQDPGERTTKQRRIFVSNLLDNRLVDC